MRDVAKLAGVSHQTVSRVINEHPNVRAETRERVLAAMRSLNYRRNLAARTLATRESHTLGIVGFETTLFGPESMLYGIESAARAAGYLVSVATVRDLSHQPVLEAVDRLVQHGVDGIIAIAPKPAVTTALTHAPAGIPCVAVGGDKQAGFPTVRVDNSAGAGLVTQHLLDLGHATVHHVAGPLDWPEAQARVDGWRRTLYAAGAVVPPVTAGWWDAAAGYEQGRRLAEDPTVTAVFCANDRIALGVLRAMHESGRRVPDDVSVAGFDDMPDSGYFLPPLTTVHQDFAELGRRALSLLLRHMAVPDGDAPPEDVVVAPRMTPRVSAAPPRP
ncbi:LacI family DNA-binding transcriptional regulator [Actinoplanes utahensis]|uniref:LacI family transcriptional regulator n=1 Tax=Actinoplanes utahensis TaxID=1869 RepID=A0A0A6UMU9_ACTUT|nr:LacI family DNA-binding transcriptional regulator [Actinoplanes utahensis]KHD76741.1 LacI family transcriptional regulator [Actinoplanes utahensis]GIF33191.1 LacI family transcriptional regulator [Actinoplanes utahensis]